LHAFDIRERPKQLGERTGVWAGEHGVALFAVKSPPPTQQTLVVSELFVFFRFGSTHD